MTKIIFAAISPHPPIILPSVGSPKDRAKVKNTIEALEKLGRELKEKNLDSIIISSPHPDWGFEVPLHFLLNSKFKSQKSKSQFKIQNYQNPANITVDESSDAKIIYPVLTTFDSPQQHFEWGKKFYLKIGNWKLEIALIASGDLSHCLRADGPYGFHPQGPKFDAELIESLKKKDIKKILGLDEMFPEAAECGLRSFCFLLGILETAKLNWQPEILSYEGPFGVGYLVVNFKLNS